MKLNVLQENFSKGLALVSKAVSTKPSIPILSNVLITAKKDSIVLSATDLEIGMNVNIPAEVEIEGVTTINARTTSEFVLSLSAGKLKVVLEEGVLKISNDLTSSKFSTINSDDFPTLPTTNTKPMFSLSASEFYNSISKIVVAAALDDSRPVLTGVLFESLNDSLILVGVDGYRLAKKVLNVKLGENLKLIIPARALNEVLRVIDPLDTENMVSFHYMKDKNQVIFEYKEVEIATRLIEGEFPDYKSILPSSNSISFVMNKEQFSSNLKTANVFAKNVLGNKVVFELNTKQQVVNLSSSAPELGENNTKMDVHNIQGVDFKTAYNARYLMNMINTIKGEMVKLETNGATLPAVFSEEDDDSYIHIVMPMKLD